MYTFLPAVSSLKPVLAGPLPAGKYQWRIWRRNPITIKTLNGNTYFLGKSGVFGVALGVSPAFYGSVVIHPDLNRMLGLDKEKIEWLLANSTPAEEEAPVAVGQKAEVRFGRLRRFLLSNFRSSLLRSRNSQQALAMGKRVYSLLLVAALLKQDKKIKDNLIELEDVSTRSLQEYVLLGQPLDSWKTAAFNPFASTKLFVHPSFAIPKSSFVKELGAEALYAALASTLSPTFLNSKSATDILAVLDQFMRLYAVYLHLLFGEVGQVNQAKVNTLAAKIRVPFLKKALNKMLANSSL